MKTKKTTTKLLVILSVVVLLILAGYIAVFLFFKSVASDVSTLAAEFLHQTQRDERLSSVEKIVRDTEDKREELDAYFISEDDIVTYITSIEEIGNKAGSPIDVMSVSTLPREDGVDTLELNISLDGSWASVVKTLALLEKQKTATTFTNLNLSGSSDLESETTRWFASATLRAPLFEKTAQ